MDVHIRRAVTSALRLRSINVLTAQEDGAAELDDELLLERATVRWEVSDLVALLASERVVERAA